MKRPSWLRWLARFSLRGRLLGMLFVIVSLILGAQTLVSLSGELSALDRQVEMEGTIVAQGIATACADLLDAVDPTRFDPLLVRVRRKVHLVSLAVLRNDGRIVGHSDPRRVGQQGRTAGALGLVRPGRGLAATGGPLEYRVSAPILRGTESVVGVVELAFLSDEVPRRAVSVISRASILGLFWLGVAAVAGILYLRRITRPLGDLTRAAQALRTHGGELPDTVTLAEPASTRDELGLLQGAFSDLVVALRAERQKNSALVAEQQQMNAELQVRVDRVTADLREASTYLQSVIRCIGEGLLTCNSRGEVVQANEAAHRLLEGLGTPSEGRSVGELFPGAAPLADAVRRAVERGTAESLELVTDGAAPQRVLACQVYPLTRGNGAASEGAASEGAASRGAVLLLQDVTNRQERERRLRAQDRLASLGTLAAGFAHEFGNYMHAIHGFAELLLDAVPEEDVRRRDVATIHHESTRAIALLERFMQFARPGHGESLPTLIDPLVREAVELCSYRLRKAGITTVDRLGLASCEVACDARLLRQVFMNLVLNAVEAMQESDDRRLTLASRELDDGLVEISITDTGSGIPPELRERIFDPFFTTKDLGTGLGLAIAHQIVARHGGSLRVESELGVGTTFRTLLPRQGPEGGRP
ncbi:MAG: HAMP domain-containing protein [Deltaproteobacteria bacterium]|nr:HAMP domain-containing protein [Deltaproteobacteria bacterium]